VSEGDQELRALMIRYQGGSPEAFQEIYAQLAPGVRAGICRIWQAASKSPMIYFRKRFCKCTGREPHTTRHIRLDLGCSVWLETFF